MAVTSLLLGNGLPDAISAPIQLDPNNPKNAYAQEQYNMAAIQVRPYLRLQEGAAVWQSMAAGSTVGLILCSSRACS